MIKNWDRKDSYLLQKTRILDFCEAIDVSPYTKKEHPFVFIDSANWVNLVPITEKNEIVMIRQYRHGCQRITLEIPGGMVDEGESPEAAASRECQEETGYSVMKLQSLGKLNPNPALFNNSLYTFYGYVTSSSMKAHSSETEKTEVELIPMNRVKPLMLDNNIDHALVCATLWRFFSVWERGD